MDNAERKVLINEKPNIKAHLLLENSILDELEREGILTGSQIQKIQAEKTSDGRIDKLLFILERRGCHAFTKFVAALQNHSSHVAEMLKKALDKENRDVIKAENPADDWIDQLVVFLERRGCEAFTKFVDALRNHSPHFVEMLKQTLDKEVNRNGPPMTGITHINIGMVPVLFQQNLDSLYTKLQTHMTTNNMRELSFNSPVPVSFEMIEDLLENMLNNLNECSKKLGGHKRSASLLTLITKSKESITSLEKDLKAKTKQSNKYADTIIKLENKVRAERLLLDSIQMKNENQKKANEKLLKENENLNKEIENLRKGSDTLQKQIQELSSKNYQLKKQVNEEKIKAEESLENFNVEVEETSNILQKRIQELSSEKEELEKKVNDLEVVYDEKKKNDNSVVRFEVQVAETNNILQKQIEELNSKNDELKEKVTCLEAEKEDEKKKADESLANHQVELEEMGKKHQKHLADMEELKGQNLINTSETTICQHCQMKITHEHTNQTKQKVNVNTRRQKKLFESSNAQTRNTHHKRSRPQPPIFGARTDVAPVPSWFETISVTKSYEPTVWNAFPGNETSRHHNEPPRKFFHH